MRIDEPHTIAPADPLSHAWKSGYAQAKEEMACDALDRIEALQAERDQALTAMTSYLRQRDEARADAKRYRWLREQNYYVDATLCVVDRSEDHPRLADLDAATDAAIAAQEKKP